MRAVEVHWAVTPDQCADLGLEWNEEGYGLLFCEEADGTRWTAVGDIAYCKLLGEASPAGGPALDLPAEAFEWRPGWPVPID